MSIGLYWSGNPRKPTDRERALIQELRISAMGKPSPILAANHALQKVIDARALNAEWPEYLEAIRVAIQDDASLFVDTSRESRSDVLVFFQELERILAQRHSPE